MDVVAITFEPGLARREERLMASTLSPIVEREATGLGAIAGFSCSCSCGLELRSSLRSALELDAAAHAAYHARKAGQ